MQAGGVESAQEEVTSSNDDCLSCLDNAVKAKQIQAKRPVFGPIDYLGCAKRFLAFFPVDRAELAGL